MGTHKRTRDLVVEAIIAVQRLAEDRQQYARVQALRVAKTSAVPWCEKLAKRPAGKGK